MLDWITLVIEAVGVVILLMWIVIPIREFRLILKAVARKSPAAGELQRPREDGPRA